MQLRLERKAEAKFIELNDAMREYHEVFGCKLLLLPQKPVLNDFYAPSNEQHDSELAFIAFDHDWDWRSLVVLGRLNFLSVGKGNSHLIQPTHTPDQFR